MEKNYKKIVKRILYVIITLLLILTVMIMCSPYGDHKGFNYKLVRQSVIINAPAEKVFQFLGNSVNASRWSSFVNHITVLNSDSFTDGNVGSRRRCFRNKNESGMQWDEIIDTSKLNEERILSIYNLVNFPATADNLASGQLYKPVNTNQCQLTFTFFFKDANPTLTESVKVYFTAYILNSIFKKNLANIKQITEHEFH